MPQRLGDAQVLTLTDHTTMTPSWLIQLYWSLVRIHTIPHCTGLLFTDVSEYELNGSLTDIHLGPIDCLIVQLVSYLLACVV